MLEEKSKAISKALGDLPWERIMEFILQMVSMCFPSGASAAEAKHMGPLRSAAMRIHIRMSFGVRGRTRVRQIQDAIMGELTNMSDDEVRAVWLLAKQQLEPIDFPV